ncbi:MAG: hypothetical protein ACYDCE_12125 [Candidatus Acidiferrales bacterium]
MPQKKESRSLASLIAARLHSWGAAHRMVSSTMKDFCQRKSAYAPSDRCWALAFSGAEKCIKEIGDMGNQERAARVTKGAQVKESVWKLQNPYFSG